MSSTRENPREILRGACTESGLIVCLFLFSGVVGSIPNLAIARTTFKHACWSGEEPALEAKVLTMVDMLLLPM